jgi:uncharacterized membrane-anchored protein
VTGRVRVVRRVDVALERVETGDVVVLDVLDLDRATADRLCEAGVAAVVNAAPTSSGRFPVRGARRLVESGVVLIDDVGGELLTKVRDGDLLRIDRGELWVGEQRVGSGNVQSVESVEDADEAARGGLQARVSALVADAGRRLTADALSDIDGTTFPELRARIDGSVVVVVTATAERDELREVARRLHGRRRVIIGVGAGADRAADAKLRCDVVVIGRDAHPARPVGRKSEVVALDSADLDVAVPPGVTRVHAASVGAPEDTAVLLAHAAGAALVITCGVDESLDGLLDRSAHAGSVPVLVRLRTGATQLSASALLKLPRKGSSRPALVPTALLCAGFLVVGLVAGAGAVQDSVARVVPGIDADSGSGSVVSPGQAAADVVTVQGILLAGRLDGRPVTVITMPGAPDPAPVLDGLRAAGAAVDQPLIVNDAYLDPNRARVLRDLAVQLAPARLRDEIGQEPAAADPTAQTDRVFVDALTARDGADLGQEAESGAALFEGLARIGAITEPARLPVRSELFVVLAPAAADDAAATRMRTLVAELDAAGQVVVAAPVAAASDDGGDPAASTGLVALLREAAADGPAAGVSTVDDVGTASGRVAVVLALAGLAAGREPEDLGVATDADAGVPELDGASAPRVGG